MKKMKADVRDYVVEKVKEMILEKIRVKDVLIMDTKGVSSMYANDGGVIVTL